MPQVTALLFTSMKSKEGITFTFGDEDEVNHLPIDDLSDDDESSQNKSEVVEEKH